MLWTVQKWSVRLVASVTQSVQIMVHSGLSDDKGRNN